MAQQVDLNKKVQAQITQLFQQTKELDETKTDQKEYADQRNKM